MAAPLTTDGPGVLVEHVLATDTERSIQRARVGALVLAVGLAVSFGDDRSLGVTAAVVLLALVVAGTWLVLRRARSPRTVRLVGWGSFTGDVAVCTLLLAAVADDPVDPVRAVTAMVALEAAVRWGSWGALGGGLVAGALEVAWAASGYAAIGRVLPVTSIVFRLLAGVLIALPAGVLIDRMRRQRAHTHRLFEHSGDATLIVAGRRVAAANPAAARLLDAAVERLEGRPFDEVAAPTLGVEGLATLLAAEGPVGPVAVVGRDGSERWLEVEAEVAADADLVFVVARDVTEQRTREERLRHEARHDVLTGLPNRAAMRSVLGERLARRVPVGLVFLDLDGFKRVNDEHGHVVGDALLVEVARRLQDVTRDDDHVHRWAGDEFAVVVDRACGGLLEGLAERVGATLAEPLRVGDVRAHVRASVGTALAGPGDNVESLLQRADEAMYRDKRGEAPDAS